jgi:uncharacterized protein with NAD-binding domain and iron-sulfur cluster
LAGSTGQAPRRDSGLDGRDPELDGEVAAASRPAPGASAGRRRVAVFGAGVGGLTAAHELAERGFEVTVYERRDVPGGKARSLFVPHTGTDGRRDLPGEHGHRMVLGFYRNLPDTLRRIPGATGGTVHDSLTPVARFDLARAGDRAGIPIPVGRDKLDPGTPVLADANLLVTTLAEVVQGTPILPHAELLYLAGKVSMLFSSCAERRFGQWEHRNWWEFIQAARMSEDYQRIWGGGVQILEALKPRSASVRTIGQGLESIFFSLFGLGSDGPFDCVFNGPTSEAWIDPWIAHLRTLGVRFAFGWQVEDLEVREGRVTAARARTPDGATARVDADWFVTAVPADRAVKLWNSALRAADPRLAAMDGLRQTWSSGIQYFLRRPVSAPPGHVFHIDAPWKLASISQSRLWDAPFSGTWGDGRAQESLSVVISDWDTPGILYGKPARECTREEVSREVWAQMQAHLNKNGELVLDEAMVHSWYLDEAITEAGDGLRNDDPFLMNSVGSWDLRPEASTAVANLFLAADYVRTYSNVDFATMETANEAARRSVNALLKAANAAEAPPVRTFARYELPEFARAQAVDRERWRQGLPHVLDTEEH